MDWIYLLNKDNKGVKMVRVDGERQAVPPCTRLATLG